MSPNSTHSILSLPRMDVSAKKEAKASSPEDEWEDWMEWNATTAQIHDQQPTPPSDIAGEGTHRHISRGAEFSDTSPQSAKKRKLSTEPTTTMASTSGFSEGKSTSVQNRSHSIVEKRYRTNLNDKIAELRNSIPALRENGQSPVEVGGSAPAFKHNKATILTKAIEYIRLLEKRNSYLEEANDALRNYARQTTREIDNHENNPRNETLPSRANISETSPVDIQPPSTDSKEPRGLIPVPEEMKRLRDIPPQPHYADQTPFIDQPEETSSSSGSVSIRGGKLFGKLMVGSVAGLMIMDKLAGSSSEQKRERGLFAIPFASSLPSLRLIWTFQAHLATIPYSFLLLPVLRGLLIFCVLGLLLFLYLFNSKPKLGKPPPMAALSSTPSPSASPVEVRRNAWLTSIQTVWVPRHSMLPEMLALVSETLAYMTRQLLGWRSYSWLTGRSEEEETARIRAWEIALDAQLTGGDAELNKIRLVLTLWASGTLPKTPARLMLKALHIRVLFWQASNSVWICNACDSAARKLARYQWNLAQKMLGETIRSEDDSLPKHLVNLLRQPFEDVLTDVNIQRAHNLAWNRPASDAQADLEKDSIVEDTAMCGPLDIVALWWTDSKLQRGLNEFIKLGGRSQSSLSLINLARRTAPPGSVSYIRALTATAVISEVDLAPNVTELLQAVPLPSSTLVPSSFANINAFPKAIDKDTLVAIRCAEALMNVTSSQRQPEYLYEALELLGETFYDLISIDLLAFTAAHQLVSVLLRHPALDRQHLRTLKQILSNTTVQMDGPAKYNRLYKLPLRNLLEIGIMKRRASYASVDTGYGSMSDEDAS